MNRPRVKLGLRRTGLGRQTPFEFRCARCLRCCHGKAIQVNPYEIARLASHLGMTTTAFLAEHTQEGGTLLKWDENNVCVFLGPRGCRVHRDRPLVCRLYPLGRHIHQSGEETFSEVEPQKPKEAKPFADDRSG